MNCAGVRPDHDGRDGRVRDYSQLNTSSQMVSALETHGDFVRSVYQLSTRKDHDFPFMTVGVRPFVPAYSIHTLTDTHESLMHLLTQALTRTHKLTGTQTCSYRHQSHTTREPCMHKQTYTTPLGGHSTHSNLHACGATRPSHSAGLASEFIDLSHNLAHFVCFSRILVMYDSVK